MITIVTGFSQANQLMSHPISKNDIVQIILLHNSAYSGTIFSHFVATIKHIAILHGLF